MPSSVVAIAPATVQAFEVALTMGSYPLTHGVTSLDVVDNLLDELVNLLETDSVAGKIRYFSKTFAAVYHWTRRLEDKYDEFFSELFRDGQPANIESYRIRQLAVALQLHRSVEQSQSMFAQMMLYADRIPQAMVIRFCNRRGPFVVQNTSWIYHY